MVVAVKIRTRRPPRPRTARIASRYARLHKLQLHFELRDYEQGPRRGLSFDWIATALPAGGASAAHSWRPATPSFIERGFRRADVFEVADGWEQLAFDWFYEPPKTRAECLPGGWNTQRPCPFVRCRHHNYLEVDPVSGRVRINHPGMDPDEMPPGESCSLDQAAHGGLHLHEAAPMLGMTPQWMNVIELGALAALKQSARLQALVDPDEAQTLAERILDVFADLSRRGQRLVSSADVCHDLGVDQRDRMMRVYVEIGRLARDGKLEHDGGRDNGKRRGARLYWLAVPGV